MNDLACLLRTLDDLYYTVSQEEYEQERTKVASQVALLLPGFTIAHAIELGTVGAGEGIYQHGGVGHVLLPCST
jgi:hypothetical protein